MRGRTDDPVTPELRAYVFRRDGRCVVGLLAERGRIPDQGLCRNAYGLPIIATGPWPASLLTFAHVRDRAGGRTAKRPPSTPRRGAAACYGHHIARPVVDQADVRPEIDRYLEELEGPDLDDSRPWETVRRVRARGVSLPTSEGGVDG